MKMDPSVTAHHLNILLLLITTSTYFKFDCSSTQPTSSSIALRLISLQARWPLYLRQHLQPQQQLHRRRRRPSHQQPLVTASANTTLTIVVKVTAILATVKIIDVEFNSSKASSCKSINLLAERRDVAKTLANAQLTFPLPVL